MLDEVVIGFLSKNIRRYEDGVYRWAYDVSLVKNPVILFMLWKIFGGIAFGLYLFILLITTVEKNFVRAVSELGLLPVWFIGGALAFSTFGYLIYAIINGGRYCVLFEMDDKGIKHMHLRKQFKKAQVVGMLGALVGATTGNLSVAGAGLLASSRYSIYTAFSDIQYIKPQKHFNTIKFGSLLDNNQIYAEKDDFDSVLTFMYQHCSQVKC